MKKTMHKYKQAAQWVKDKIYEGEYRPGDKLPSIQELSQLLSYNPDTIVKAYRQLEEEHLAYAVAKSGYYVMKHRKGSGGQPVPADLITIRTPDSINPYKDYYHCMEKAIAFYEKRLVAGVASQGMPELIQTLVKHLVNFRLFVRQDDVFVTSGAQQALYVLSAMAFPGGRDTVLVEQPTYAVMLRVLQCTRTPVAGIRRGPEGIDLGELEGIFRQGGIKFFYMMPRYQNPTGFSYSREQKEGILRLAKEYGVYVVEDDYLADLEVDGKADAIYGMGGQEQVVHIRSFSKTLLPGLRLGMCLVPRPLRESFLRYKHSMDIGTSVLPQGALEIYLKSSMYRHHVQRTRKHYKEKMDALRQACAEWPFDAGRWHIPLTGIYAYLELADRSAASLVKRLAGEGVMVTATDECYIDGFSPMEGIRLCVCNAEQDVLRQSVKTIGKELGRKR